MPTFLSFLLAVVLLSTSKATKSKDPGVSQFSFSRNCEKIGTSPGWHAAAEQIKANYAPANNPCYDFYDFACGNFVAQQKFQQEEASTWNPPNRRVEAAMLGKDLLKGL